MNKFINLQQSLISKYTPAKNLGNTKPLARTLAYLGVSISLTLVSLFTTSNTAKATCADVAGLVSCIADDNDGFFSPTNINNLTINNGITVNDSGGDVGGFGIIDINGDVTGTLLNNGTIYDAIGINDAGINVVGTLNELINNGKIIGSTEGVFSSDDIDNLVNFGNITGGLAGVVSGDDIDNLINFGSISGGTFGVYAIDDITSLINTGIITGGTIAVNSDNDINKLINTGTIVGGDFGIYAGIGGMSDGLHELTNSGVISGGIHAILSDGAVDTNLTLLPGSDIFGAIDLGGGTNTLVVGNGLSIDHLFDVLPDIIDASGAPFVTDGTRVLVVDPSSFAQQDEILFDITRGVWGTVFNNIGDGRKKLGSSINGFSSEYSLGASPSSDRDFANITKRSQLWASAFGNHRFQDNDAPATTAHHDMFGFIAGVDRQLNSSMLVGGFLGFSETEVNTIANQQETDVESFFGGVYASLNLSHMVIDLGLTGGSTDHKNKRLVDNNQLNGLQTLTGSFDGTFVAPEFAFRNKIEFSNLTLQQTLRAGYAGLFLDGYSEKGSTAPLSVGDRELHILHARLEIAALMHSAASANTDILFSPYLGIEGRSLIDGQTVNIILLNQNLAFEPGGEDDVAIAFAGVRFSIAKSENFGVFAGLEGSIDTEQSSTIKGNLGLKWQF